MAKLQQQAETVHDDSERFQLELDSLVMERQKIITWARKGTITDEDLEYQLTALTLQEMNVKKELANCSHTVELAALKDWEVAAKEYFYDLRAGIQSLNITPESDEEQKEIFDFKQNIIKRLSTRLQLTSAGS